MEDTKSILHELYVFSEWKPEPEYLQKPDNILPENISALWRWLKFFGPKKSLIDSITATKRSEYATIAARTTVSRDAYPQWRKLVWSPDCSFVVLAYGNGVISFFDLTASNLFNIPTDCTRPGGLECTDNTHAVADIIFMPLRVKDNKWNWEVLVVTYDGKLRGYLVSQTDGYKLHHTFRFSSAGGVAAMTYCEPHSTLYVCGVPHVACKDPSSPLSAGITAWRILNDEPWYKLSVVSDELDTLVTHKFQLYIPFVSNKNLAFVVQMVLSPDGDKLVCLHCNGDISVWRLPLLKLLHRWPLSMQPQHDLDNPLVKDDKLVKNKGKDVSKYFGADVNWWSGEDDKLVKNKGKDVSKYFGADVNWWSGEEIILSRFSGAVTICDIENMMNILGKKPEFFQGSPQLTCAHDGTFMVLECESNVLPAKRNRSDDSMEVVKVEEDTDDTMLELGKELIKSVLYAITDMETFQPKPRKITVVSRVYRLLGVKSTTPNELFNRKIESGNYTEALTLAETFNLDSDLVYQQQWRKNPVSTDAIQKYLSKVSKKIWAVHQCVDRLPETLSAAKELLQFGLQLTNEKILEEINKGKPEDEWKDPDDITLEDLNAYTSELLRCRHVMLFYKERLRLYEAILRAEKSTYQKDEYDRLRSNSLVHSALELAKEGRIAALRCLWPNIKPLAMQSSKEPLPDVVPVKMSPPDHEDDWCRKEDFRSIWSSNWSEDSTPETEQAEPISEEQHFEQISAWYEKRAREMQDRCGLITHSVALVTIATVSGKIEGLESITFHLRTLMTLIYCVNLEDVTLDQLEKMTVLDTCKLMMQNTSPETFLEDLKNYVIPHLKRADAVTGADGCLNGLTEYLESISVDDLTYILLDLKNYVIPHLKRADAVTGADGCLNGLTEYLESISVDDLTYILLVLKSPHQFELDVRTHLELAERCLLAYSGTDQLDMACDMLDTLLKDSDGSISNSEIVRRVKDIELLVSASSKMSWRGVKVPPKDLSEMHKDPKQVHNLLTRMARSLSLSEDKPTQQDWEKLLKDILELQESLFSCITKEQCYEIYASSLLTSGDVPSIKLASEVLTCTADIRRSPHLVNYITSVQLVSNAAKEYFNSASSLGDPALELARACLSLIKDGNPGIQEELDLISALQILNAFNLGVLPIQVRLCEDRMTLIEDCLKLDASAYLASHKLLKLAKLLRICGDDELTREGKVLQRVGEYAILAGPAGCAAAADVARRLATIRYAPAAPLLSHVATFAHAHADRATRRDLFAAAATHCSGDDIEDILRARSLLFYTAAEVARRLATIRYAPAAPLLSHVATFAHAHADRATRRDLFAVTHCSGDDIEDILRASAWLAWHNPPDFASACLQMTTTLGALANWRPPAADEEYFQGLILTLEGLYPEGWRDWLVREVTYKDLFGESITSDTESRLRFAIPTLRLARIFRCGNPERAPL
ncbi:secretory pathway protein sec39 domain-containing protein [Phthorimaea operculella]|nr:secretory pathway protein sec39 domain-containing protein [Phthorimaea operculella]